MVYYVKCGFCKKLLLYERNSDQLPTFFILSSLLGGCNSKATANPPKSDDRMKKIGQSCICKEVTSYKIHSLDKKLIFVRIKLNYFTSELYIGFCITNSQCEIMVKFVLHSIRFDLHGEFWTQIEF